MASKIYTAEEIRHTAENLEWNRAHGMEAIKIASEHVIDQLRYASEVVGRAWAEHGQYSVKYRRVDNEFDTAMVDEIDYILTGKEAEEQDDNGK